MNHPLTFMEDKNGYNRSQVNAYIEKVLREYENMRQEYKALEQERKTLEEKNRQLEQSLSQVTHEKKAAAGLATHFRVKISQLERENARLRERSPGVTPEFSDEVARVLMDAELLAQQIIDRAKQQAEDFAQQAQAEQKRILAAQERLLAEVKQDWESLRVKR
jgi:cell division septum initiation protein DivIVA